MFKREHFLTAQTLTMLYFRKIHREAFQNCTSLQYMNYGDKVDDMDSSKTQYGIDLKHTNHFDNNVFRDCTSIKSIKVYEHQYFRDNALLGCDNLQRVILPPYFHFNDCLALYNHPTQLQEIMIRSKVRNISRAVVYLALLPWVFRNPGLLDTKCTEDGLLPIQVFFEVFLLLKPKNWRCNDMELVEILRFFLMETPTTISLFMLK